MLDKKRTVPGAPKSPKTVLLSAPPGARTLDTLIKRKGFQGGYSSDFWRFTRLTPYAIMSLLLTLSSRKEVALWTLLLLSFSPL